MKEEINDLEKLLARMERLEKGLSIKIEKFNESEQALTMSKEELILEVEEIKNLRKSLKESVVTALKDNVKELIPQLLPSIVKGFQQQTQAFVESSLKDLQQLKSDIDQTIIQTKTIVSSQKREMTLRRVGLSLVSCLSVLLTALSIFYFFPQHINYRVTPSIASKIVFGEAFMENAEKLTPEQRKFFIDKASDKLKFYTHPE